MILQITIVDNENPLRRWSGRAEGGRLVIGAGETADAQVEGWPGGDLVINHDPPSNGFVLDGAEDDLRVNGESVAAGPAQLRSGDRLQIGERYSLRFMVRFETTGQQRRIGILPILVSAAIVTILIFQLGIGIWLPLAMKQESAMGMEISRQRTLMLLDLLRNGISTHSHEQTDETVIVTLGLVGEELDNMALYLRHYDERLDARQITQMHDDLQALYSILLQLVNKELYPPDQGIDLDAAMEKILAAEKETHE